MYSSLCVRLPDVWVNESDRLQQKTKVVHLSKLPTDTAVLLDPNIYRSVCLSVCLSQLVHWYTTNKKKNSWIKYLNPFFPTGCSSDRLQRNSTVLSLPANQTSRRIASFSPLSPALHSSSPSPRGCWEISDLLSGLSLGLHCFLY